MLGMLAVRAARRRVAAAPAPRPGNGDAVERLRRQVEPLATGDLAVRLPEAEGPLGEIHRTLNLLIGGVSDLVAAADDASLQVLGSVQDGRGGLAGLKVEAERARQLADEVVERARHALSAARALGGRTKSKESTGRAASGGPAHPPVEDAVAHGSLAERLEEIAEVIGDLAEQAHVLAVGISVQAAAADAPAVLRSVGDDVQVLAEQAGRTVGRIGPLVQAVLEESRTAPDLQPQATSERVAGGSAAGRRVADQVAALAELAAGLRASADRVARAQEEAAASLGALADLAHRLRRATGRFRLPG
jgi:twitching motility protein PilJ